MTQPHLRVTCGIKCPSLAPPSGQGNFFTRTTPHHVEIPLLFMSSEPAEAPKTAEGAPAQSLPVRPAKQPKEPKEKGAKGPKNTEVRTLRSPPPLLSN